MLTAYGDRGRVREALRLLAEVLTQGRAADHGVAAYVQEPSKDVVDVRDLFDTRICLGVTTASHVDMALGEGARDRGALADEIPGDPQHAGIGFVIDPITRLPIRFRAGHVTDPDIDDLVTRCTPHTNAPDQEQRTGRSCPSPRSPTTTTTTATTARTETTAGTAAATRGGRHEPRRLPPPPRPGRHPRRGVRGRARLRRSAPPRRRARHHRRPARLPSGSPSSSRPRGPGCGCYGNAARTAPTCSPGQRGGPSTCPTCCSRPHPLPRRPQRRPGGRCGDGRGHRLGAGHLGQGHPRPGPRGAARLAHPVHRLVLVRSPHWPCSPSATRFASSPANGPTKPGCAAGGGTDDPPPRHPRPATRPLRRHQRHDRRGHDRPHSVRGKERVARGVQRRRPDAHRRRQRRALRLPDRRHQRTRLHPHHRRPGRPRAPLRGRRRAPAAAPPLAHPRRPAPHHLRRRLPGRHHRPRPQRHPRPHHPLGASATPAVLANLTASPRSSLRWPGRWHCSGRVIDLDRHRGCR